VLDDDHRSERLVHGHVQAARLVLIYDAFSARAMVDPDDHGMVDAERSPVRSSPS